MDHFKSLGQIACEAHTEHSFGIALATGVVLPEWDELSDRAKAVWQATAEAVKNAPEPQMHRDETLFPRGDA